MPPRKRKTKPPAVMAEQGYREELGRMPDALAAHVDSTLAALSAELPEGARLVLDETPVLPPWPLTSPPTPTSYRASWWPAQVHLPDATVVRQAKVFATSAGLYIYTGRPDGDQPDYYFPIDYSKTPKPPADYALRQKAIRITTPYGEVRVHKLAGCGCNHPLKAWRPTWAHRIEPWSA